jgi:hypothetical protein
MDLEIGRSTVFDFVTYSSAEEARVAITKMDGNFSSNSSHGVAAMNHLSVFVCAVIVWKLH